MTKTFEEYSLDAVARVAALKAEGSDLAFVFMMSEFIDVVGQKQMLKMVPALEAKFKKAMADYQAGRV